MDSERTLSSAATAAQTAQPSDAGGIEIRLVPDEVEVALRPEEMWRRSPRRHPGAQGGGGWHHVVPAPGALVSLWSRDDRLRLICLSARGAGRPGWNPRWARWSFAVRWAPESIGGAAVTAQDVLAEDESTLTLLLLPGEQRSVTLEFAALLDGETEPGDFLFEVVATDAEAGGEGVAVDAAPVVATAPGRLRLHHPPSELLGRLPAIYAAPSPDSGNRFGQHEDRPFFERFLCGFEDALAPTQVLLAHLYRFFDADTAPADFLPWLATWVSLLLDENWPVMKRRRLIQEAVELYRWRGTRRGLARYLEIYAGVTPQIHDQPYAGMRLGPATRLGQDTLLGDVPPHTFVVTLAVPDPRAVNEQIVRDIIESEKPAHAAYELNIVRRAAGEG